MTRDEFQLRAREFSKRGSALPQSKLNDETVRMMRREYQPNSRTHGARAIARRLGLHYRTVEKALTYETWIHVR